MNVYDCWAQSLGRFTTPPSKLGDAAQYLSTGIGARLSPFGPTTSTISCPIRGVTLTCFSIEPLGQEPCAAGASAGGRPNLQGRIDVKWRLTKPLRAGSRMHWTTLVLAQLRTAACFLVTTGTRAQRPNPTQNRNNSEATPGHQIYEQSLPSLGKHHIPTYIQTHLKIKPLHTPGKHFTTKFCTPHARPTLLQPPQDA